MKSLKEMFITVDILESSNMKYDEITNLAQKNETYHDVEPRLARFAKRSGQTIGEAFELTFNKIILHVECLKAGSTELIIFELNDKHGRLLYKNYKGDIFSVNDRFIDWYLLITNPKKWCENMIDSIYDYIQPLNNSIEKLNIELTKLKKEQHELGNEIDSLDDIKKMI